MIHPQGLDALCCGQPFASKGYPEQADRKKSELLKSLLAASRNGKDPVKFIRDKLADRLVFKPEETTIAAPLPATRDSTCRN